jgi:heat shock protein HslJ
LLADNRLSFQADCNRGSGSYTLSGSQLTLQPGAITLAACPPGSQDSVFIRDLGSVVSYVMNGEQLVLNLRVDSGNMLFKAQPPASFTGVTWRVVNYNNGRGGVVSVLPDVPLTVAFDDAGRVSGDAGCNMFFGQYSVTGSALSIGPLATTRRACVSDELTRQEQAFLAALAASTTYELTGDRLTLRDAGGATQVVLVRPTN